MKRWIWLLAVPSLFVWNLTVSSGSYSCSESWDCENPCYSKGVCLDYAEALNEAHAQRNQPKGPPQLEDVERCVSECLAQMKDGTLRTGGGYKDPGSPPAYDRLPADKPFNYKDACGQDDCGVDPK